MHLKMALTTAYKWLDVLMTYSQYEDARTASAKY